MMLGLRKAILGFPWLEQNEGLIDTAEKFLYLRHTPSVIAHGRREQLLPQHGTIIFDLQPDPLSAEGPNGVMEVMQDFFDLFAD